MDPTLLTHHDDEHISGLTYDTPFPDSCFFDGEADPLHITESRPPGDMSCSMPQSGSEGLESRVMETQVSVPSGSEAPISSTVTSQKRKYLGPSREYVPPPLKKGGQRGKMTQTKRQDRKRITKLGTCITCRMSKKGASNLCDDFFSFKKCEENKN